MRKPKTPSRICGDCLHVSACMAWNSGRLYDADATHCVNWKSAADVVEVKRGKWKNLQSAECSECGHIFPTFMLFQHYCPNCGARMEAIIRQQNNT